jgi:hypothetical protein
MLLQNLQILGLMSWTSLDGLDIAYVKFQVLEKVMKYCNPFWNSWLPDIKLEIRTIFATIDFSSNKHLLNEWIGHYIRWKNK